MIRLFVSSFGAHMCVCVCVCVYVCMCVHPWTWLMTDKMVIKTEPGVNALGFFFFNSHLLLLHRC